MNNMRNVGSERRELHPPRGGRLMLTLGVVAAVLSLSACAAQAGSPHSITQGVDHMDGAGLTREEVAKLSIADQFELVRERDARMYAALSGVQNRLGIRDCAWGEYGVVPELGPNAWSLRGMNLDNSYFLSMWCWGTENPENRAPDLQTVLEVVETAGWVAETASEGAGRHTITADAGEGFFVSWETRPDGLYLLKAMSKTYWGDSRALLREIVLRIPNTRSGEGSEQAQVRLKFPQWSDPVVRDLR